MPLPPQNLVYKKYDQFLIIPGDFFILEQMERQFGSMLNRVEVNHYRVTGLNLMGLNFERFPSIIHRLTGLISLNLSNLGLNYIPKALQFLYKLRYLNLSQNNLQEIPTWFCQLKYLEKLSLNQNPIIDLPQSFSTLKKMRNLELEFTRLKYLPECIYDLSLLEVILIKGSFITEFDKKIGKLNHLYQINSTILPPSIGSLLSQEKWAIWELALYGTPVVQISNDVVVSLQFHRQSLKKIPASIGTLSHLQILDLAENQLVNLPSTIGLLKELRKLDISFNSVLNLPVTMSNLSKLEDCDFTWNPLYKLPSWFGKLNNLKRLYLTGTNIQEFNELLECNKLVVLYLDSNELTELNLDFTQLKQLEYIVLSYNHLGAIPESIRTICNLKYLRINLNQIANIPDWIITLQNLELLDVSDNHLTSLPSILGDHPSLSEIYFDGNPWSEFFRIHILGYTESIIDDNIEREFERNLEENSDFPIFSNNEIESNLIERAGAAIWDDLDEWGEFDPENDEFDLLIDDSSDYIEHAEFTSPGQRPFQFQTKQILENLRRFHNHITNLHNKIIQNLALDNFDLEYPDYAKYTGLLLEICNTNHTDSSRAVYELLRKSGLVGTGDLRIWL